MPLLLKCHCLGMEEGWREGQGAGMLVRQEEDVSEVNRQSGEPYLPFCDSDQLLNLASLFVSWHTTETQ